MYGCAKRWPAQGEAMIKYILLALTTLIATGCGEPSIQNLKILGTEQFTPEKWQTAKQVERARMVYSLISQHEVEKLNAKDIYSLLGPSTGYYEYDEFPAYLVEHSPPEKNQRIEYLLAFPINRDTGKVRKFIIEPPLDSK